MKASTIAVVVYAILAGLGCSIHNYPLITDSSGPYGEVVVDTFYEPAYIAFEHVATTTSDGSYNPYTVVTQQWTGDRRLKRDLRLTRSGTSGRVPLLIFSDQPVGRPIRLRVL